MKLRYPNARSIKVRKIKYWELKSQWCLEVAGSHVSSHRGRSIRKTNFYCQMFSLVCVVTLPAVFDCVWGLFGRRFPMVFFSLWFTVRCFRISFTFMFSNHFFKLELVNGYFRKAHMHKLHLTVILLK